MAPRRARRDALVDRVAEVLRFGEPTKFRFEATCRHALRSAFILGGHWGWQRADLEAATIVGDALRRIGAATRPSWWQGQPEFVDPRETCINCGGPLDLSGMEPWRHSFCSQLCKDAKNLRRERSFQYWETAAAKEAFYRAAKARLPPRACAHCGEVFAPATVKTLYCSASCTNHARPDYHPPRPCAVCGQFFSARGARREGALYCSPACFGAARRTLPDRPCGHCGRIFRPADATKRFCSRECAQAMRYQLTCQECGEAFQAGRPDARFCGNRCKKSAWRRSRSTIVAEHDNGT